MKESTANPTRQFISAASLAAVGVQVKQLDLFGSIREQVQIAQKTVKHAPIDKLSDALSRCWQELMAWSKSIAGCEPILPCKRHLDAVPVLSKALQPLMEAAEATWNWMGPSGQIHSYAGYAAPHEFLPLHKGVYPSPLNRLWAGSLAGYAD